MPLNPLRVALCSSSSEEASIVAEAEVAAGDDVTLGAGAVTLVVPGWIGPPMVLIAGGELLHLRPGMRVNMCGPGGEERLVGTFEELAARGISSPIPIRGRALSARLALAFSVFVNHVRGGDSGASASDQEAPEAWTFDTIEPLEPT